MLDFLIPIKGYLTAGVIAVVTIFIAVFRYRGDKIDDLEEDIVAKDNAIVVTAKVVASEKKAAQYVADNRVAKVTAEEEVDEANHKYAPDSKFYI